MSAQTATTASIAPKSALYSSSTLAASLPGFWDQPSTANAFTALAAVGGAVSAIMAVVAISLSRSTIREGRALRATTKRENYFTRYVTEPAMKATDAFTEAAVRITRECISRLDGAGAAPETENADATAMAAEKFQTAVLDLKGAFISIAKKWPDAELGRQLQRKVEALEDKGLQLIDELALESTKRNKIEELIRSESAAILKYLLLYDESKHKLDE